MAKFNVGDKVRATADDWVSVGKLGEVIEYDGSDIMPYKVDFGSGGYWLNEDTFELITPVKPKKSARITALETQVAALEARVEALEKAGQYPLTERFERESSESNCEAVDRILADIERKAKPTLEALLATYPSSKLSANERRADVIRYAKAFVADIVGNGTNFTWDIGGYKKQAVRASFHVNTEKGAVTALIHGHYSRHLYEKGIAKCDPDDVFNADIGKAIALARALGVEVPTEFVKAVQPTEVVVGQRVYVSPNYPNDLVAESTSVTDGTVRLSLVKDYRKTCILDDTDAVYE